MAYRVIIIGAVVTSLVSFDYIGVSMSRDGQTKPNERSHVMAKMDDAKFYSWQSQWERNITAESWRRYCDQEMGEEIGWLISPFLEGFYFGYLTTGSAKWVDMFFDCADRWYKRAMKEPDGYLGWPKEGAAGTPIDQLDGFFADSMLGEAMALRPIVLMSQKILNTAVLTDKYGDKAKDYIILAKQIFDKWDKRGAWRDVEGGGMITVELPFGMDKNNKEKWTAGYEKRNAPSVGFSHPDNKANLIACWLLAMSDATNAPVYKERAAKWFNLMKSRMKANGDAYQIWNYWEPAGAWDYHFNILPKHWIGVHPNPAYYDIDVEGIVTAYEHGVVFNEDDISHLILTANSNGRYWTALAPYDDKIQRKFEDENNPNSWDGLEKTPWYLSRQTQIRNPSP